MKAEAGAGTKLISLTPVEVLEDELQFFFLLSSPGHLLEAQGAEKGLHLFKRQVLRSGYSLHKEFLQRPGLSFCPLSVLPSLGTSL